MNITLVFPPFFLDSMYNLPPLGLVNLATALKGTPHRVDVVDLVLAIRQGSLGMGKAIYDHCADVILDQDPDIVGFSAQCTTYPAILQISKRIKERKPATRIVLGGHNASFLDCQTLERFGFVDVVIRGEGEVTFKALMDAYEAGGDFTEIPGATGRLGTEIVQNEARELIPDLDLLPLPDYTFVPSFSTYRDACGLPRSIAILEVGRGCPYRCIYCSESLMWRQKTRTFSVARLIREMQHLHFNFGAECFLLSYDQFTADRRFVEAFCREVIQKGLNHLPWYCISRLDSVDAPLLRLMREAGCESMCYGIDSGSEKTLAFIRKRIDRNLLYTRVVETADQGIVPTLSFVIGFPEEEREDVDETLRLALRAGIVGNNNPLIQMPTVLPGTDLSTRYKTSLTRKVDTYFSLGLEFDNGRRLWSDDQMINSAPLIFSSFYNLPCPGVPLQELGLIADYFPLMVQLYPRTFLLLSVDYRRSVSRLFLKWLKWLNKRDENKKLRLTPRDTFLYFETFVTRFMAQEGPPERPYLGDLLRYETAAISVAESPAHQTDFSIDLHDLKALRPIRDENIRMETFDYDLPMIILDLKRGDFHASYPVHPTVLLFKQEGEVLEVLEINPFVRDFLTHCNGYAKLKEISQELYGRYGEHLNRQDFFETCADAMKTLGQTGLIGLK
ncbi:MAG: B12-binding domain-containing radical SAM protein [Thermodesulfobacteriota bacterium]